ncbi:hypothetical protein FW778_00275 [Ginsengibacter hankyongi]|uniref:Hemerythrin-like domain-containing protein n=1 Tax=Ginsengibacter hankyongi TaxID=2607284 RepID=A0A5J5IJG2_9BACT|nr:hypothetical protein [Ginsengibacter hankyongi]KAA9040523.1 hypothetical protein FW778_00275 [Ginsengibacter hankyongi]
MNTNPFAETENDVINERIPALEFLKNEDTDLSQIKTDITQKNGNEFYVNAESVKSVSQPFKAFRPFSRNNFGKWETDFLIDYIIKTHHNFAKKNAVIIYNLAQRAFYHHSNTHPELLTLNKIIFLFLHDLLNQMKEEEQFIFPCIRQTANDIKYAEINDASISQSLKEKIKLLENERAKAFTYLKTLRKVTNDFGIPADACDSYKTLIEKMKELEDNLNMHFYLEDHLFQNVNVRVGK